MSADTLPETESIDGKMVFVQAESVDIVKLKNASGADLALKAFSVIGGRIPVITLEAIANGARGDCITKPVSFQTKNLKTSEDTFNTELQIVYFDPSGKKFSDTRTVGYYAIGILTAVKSGGVIEVYKFEQTVLVTDEDGEFLTLEYDVTADASGTLSHDFGINFEIVDVRLICQATSGTGTITLKDSANNAITNAMVAAVDNTLASAGTIDETYSHIADGIVHFTAAHSTDRAKVFLKVKKAA